MTAGARGTVQPTLAGLAGCTACPRLDALLGDVRSRYPGYHAAPVAPFGDPSPRLLIVGLAPGMHGANRTGRPFTGDYAGELLYATLHKYGWGSAPASLARDDGLELTGCRITNAVKCLPPDNKPTPDEVRRCGSFLESEVRAMERGTAILALGVVAHAAVLRQLGERVSAHPFAHGAVHPLATGAYLFDSYHCSRYNTNTRRLTATMFEAVFTQIATHLGAAPSGAATAS